MSLSLFWCIRLDGSWITELSGHLWAMGVYFGCFNDNADIIRAFITVFYKEFFVNFIIEKASENDKNEMIQVLQNWNMHHPFFVEPEAIDLALFFVARVGGKIVGISGYTILSKEKAQTRLLAIYPEFQGSGVGKALQAARLEAMHHKGIKKVITHADRPEVILWYKKHYGYQEVGKCKKQFSIGLEDVLYATILELDLSGYMNLRQKNDRMKEAYIGLNDPHPLSPYPPLIINVALTGVIPTKTSTPHVPISVDEIVEDAIRVHDAGASIVHIHARDENGLHTCNARYYETIVSAIRRERPELICCVTTSGRNGQSFEERSEVLHLTGSAKPDMASLTLGSLNFLSGPSVNSLEMVQRLALLMRDKGIKPELEIFDSGMVNVAKYLERHQLIGDMKYFNILLGNLNTAAGTIHDLSHITSILPNDSLWAATGLGRFQLSMNTGAIIAGGHVRVGLEDNIYFDSAQTVLATNEMLVKRIARIASEFEREIALPSQTRAMLGLY